MRPIEDAFATTTGVGFLDLRLRHEEIGRWLAGEPLYEGTIATVYPPATFLLLWPLLGWLPLAAARVLWVTLSLGAVLALSLLFTLESRPISLSGSVLAFLLLPSAYATGMTIVIGQTGLVVLFAVVTSTVIAIRRDDLPSDCVAALLFVFALIKPTIAVPFFWPFLFAPRRLRPALFAGLGYLLVTTLAVLAQPRPMLALLEGWQRRLSVHAAGARGYGSLDNLASALGHPGLYFPMALVLLGALGIIVWRRRDIDAWVLLGLSALVARFFAYHRHYDDIVVVVAAFALLRLATGPGVVPARWLAGTVFSSLLAAQLMPTRFLGAPETRPLFEAFQTASRAIALLTLSWFAIRWCPEKKPCVIKRGER